MNDPKILESPLKFWGPQNQWLDLHVIAIDFNQEFVVVILDMIHQDII